MAQTTYLRAITNELSIPILLKDGQDNATFYSVAANGLHEVGPIQQKGVLIPWVKQQADMGKAMTIHWSGRIQYYLFQDQILEIISFCRDGMFDSRSPVVGANTQGGRKVLTIAPSGLSLVTM